ncbi:MAG TPA: MFS transporter [Gemmatimonadaceae bacterium]|nr:MFS transporter [Gemmatimonadaceae bacterium]
MHQPDGAPAATATRHAWYVVAVLLLLNVSSFIDRQVMALMVSPIKADLGLTDTQMGLLLGPAFAGTFAISAILLGRLVDRGNRTAIIAWGVAAWSVMCTASGVANTFGQLFAARFGVGIGEATLSPSANSLIADYFPPEKLATALSVFTSGVFIGSGLAYFIGGTVIETVSNLEPWRLPVFGEIRAWQRVFIVVGIPGLLLALLALTIREPRRSRPAGSPVHAATTSEVVSWLRRHARAYVTFGIGIATYSTVNFGTAFWFPEFFRRSHGWSPGKVGLLMGGATAIFGVVGVIAGGRLADYFKAHGKRDGNLIVLIISAVFSILAGLPLYLTNSEGVLLAALIVTNIVAAAPFGAAAAAMQEMSPSHMRGQAAALLGFMLNFVGLSLGPTVVGILNDRVFTDPAKGVALSLLAITLFGRTIAGLSVAAGLAAHKRVVAEVTRSPEGAFSA